ncbi:ester hydrolase C11orf54 homolog [Belonocnema kinseyi]|uniref:ester hydrolase C11orf54 homolog n=1 Tax=Belonocnema kinseyi TaxID=2817044 RepID=UPI00143D9E55|nr:ester hydrolase C11orf54 homolog [Belonocnema kinseyi]
MSAPLVSAGIILSAEMDLQFSPYHFHSFSDHNAGGHYHDDVTPDEIEYLGYFTPAKVVSKVKCQNSDSSLGSRRPEGPDVHV